MTYPKENGGVITQKGVEKAQKDYRSYIELERIKNTFKKSVQWS